MGWTSGSLIDFESAGGQVVISEHLQDLLSDKLEHMNVY